MKGTKGTPQAERASKRLRAVRARIGISLWVCGTVPQDPVPVNARMIPFGAIVAEKADRSMRGSAPSEREGRGHRG